MTLNVIDISSNQSRINLAHLAPGLSGVYVKATEGVGYTSTLYKPQYGQAKTLHLLRGSYHFAGSSVYRKIYAPEDEWAHFYSVIKNNVRDGIIVLDWEPYGYGMTISEEINWVKRWTELCHGTTGVWPVIYMDFNHVNMWHGFSPQLASEVAKNCAIIVAGGRNYNTVYTEFQDKLIRQSLPDYWTVFGWQYSSRGNLNGYQPIDLNVIYTDVAGWVKYSHGDNKVSLAPKVTRPRKTTKRVYYWVQPGDTLIRIGERFNVPWQRIAELNRLHPPYLIYANKTRLRIK